MNETTKPVKCANTPLIRLAAKITNVVLIILGCLLASAVAIAGLVIGISTIIMLLFFPVFVVLGIVVGGLFVFMGFAAEAMICGYADMIDNLKYLSDAKRNEI